MVNDKRNQPTLGNYRKWNIKQIITHWQTDRWYFPDFVYTLLNVKYEVYNIILRTKLSSYLIHIAIRIFVKLLPIASVGWGKVIVSLCLFIHRGYSHPALDGDTPSLDGVPPIQGWGYPPVQGWIGILPSPRLDVRTRQEGWPTPPLVFITFK